MSTTYSSTGGGATVVRSQSPALDDMGRLVFGAAAIALGIVGLIWGEFATNWHPVPPETPYRTMLAYAAAAIFVGSGAALVHRPSARIGTVGLMLLYTAFTLLWGNRVVHFPQIFGTWSGMAEELVLVLAAIVIGIAPDPRERPSTTVRVCQALFGLCAVSFGIIHFDALPQTAALVPAWLPPSQVFWAKATGIAHIAAGAALLTGIQARLAARLLTAMFVTFGLLVWLPKIFLLPTDHVVWAGNSINLALIGSAWVMADRVRNGLWPTAREVKPAPAAVPDSEAAAAA